MNIKPKNKAIYVISIEKMDEKVGNGPPLTKKLEPPAKASRCKRLWIFNFLIETVFLAIILGYGFMFTGFVLYGSTLPSSSEPSHYDQGIGVGRNDSNSINDLVLELDTSVQNKTLKCYSTDHLPKTYITFGVLFIVDCAMIMDAITRFKGVIELCKTGSIPDGDVGTTKHFDSFSVIMGATCFLVDLVVILCLAEMERMSRMSPDVRDYPCMDEYVGYFILWILVNIIFMSDMFMAFEVRRRRGKEQQNICVNA